MQSTRDGICADSLTNPGGIPYTQEAGEEVHQGAGTDSSTISWGLYNDASSRMH